MRRQQRSIDCCAVKNVTRLAERVNKMVLHWTFIASSASLPFHAPFKGKGGVGGGGEGARRRGEGGGGGAGEGVDLRISDGGFRAVM